MYTRQTHIWVHTYTDWKGDTNTEVIECQRGDTAAAKSATWHPAVAMTLRKKKLKGAHRVSWSCSAVTWSKDVNQTFASFPLSSNLRTARWVSVVKYGLSCRCSPGCCRCRCVSLWSMHDTARGFPAPPSPAEPRTSAPVSLLLFFFLTSLCSPIFQPESKHLGEKKRVRCFLAAVQKLGQER